MSGAVVIRSLPRWLLFWLVIGCLYGMIGAMLNRNPHFKNGDQLAAGSTEAEASEWQPTPMFGPSYFLAQKSIGAKRTNRGYMLPTMMDLLKYVALSGLAGAFGSGLLGFVLWPLLQLAGVSAPLRQ